MYALAFSPDGRILAVADNSDDPDNVSVPPTVKLFDVTNPRKPQRIAVLPGDVTTVSFSPDGHLLVANTEDTLLSWNVSVPKHPIRQPTQQLSANVSVSGSAFRPDGKYLAVGDGSGAIRLWQIADDHLTGEPTIFRVVGFDGRNLAFGPDGEALALASAGDPESAGALAHPHIELWDLSNPQEPTFGTAFAFGSTSLGTGPIAYSPSGSLLATDTSGTVDVWSTNSTANAEDLCGSIGDVITPAQWSKYVPGEPYDPPCPAV